MKELNNIIKELKDAKCDYTDICFNLYNISNGLPQLLKNSIRSIITDLSGEVSEDIISNSIDELVLLDRSIELLFEDMDIENEE